MKDKKISDEDKLEDQRSQYRKKKKKTYQSQQKYSDWHGKGEQSTFAISHNERARENPMQ